MKNEEPAPSGEGAFEESIDGRPEKSAEKEAAAQAPNTHSSSPNGQRIIIPESIRNLTVDEAAPAYVRILGVAVIPLHPITNQEIEKPGKAPMIRGYRKMTKADMTVPYLTKCFPKRTDRNLGAILAGNLVWLDFDAKKDGGASADAWLEENPEFRDYPRVRTQHGIHIPFVVTDLSAKDKKFAHVINEKLVIEVIPPPNPVTLPPSLRLDGEPYFWEIIGALPVMQKKELFTKLRIPENTQGRRRKKPSFQQKYKGDLKTLNLVDLLSEKGLLGECLDADEGRYTIRCPWEHEHSNQHAEIGRDTVIWCLPGKFPGFNCFHAHCDGRGVEQVLEWLEEQEPGIVDRYCNARRAYHRDEPADIVGKPLVEHPGDRRLISEVGRELADHIASCHQWFQRNGKLCQVIEDSETTKLLLREITPIVACGGIERFVTPVVCRSVGGEVELVPRSFDAKGIAPLLHAPQFLDNLPIIEHILSVPIPIRNMEGEIAQPQVGYDPALRTYLRHDAPEIETMTIEEAKAVIADIFGDFCFSSEQDRVHAIARLITPYARGIMGWTARVPLWLFIANRPRAGKDYLSGVVLIVYTGDAHEDAPLEKGSEETRKRITAALMSGRSFMHFANCQGHVGDAALIGAVTARVFCARNLGSTSAEADLELANDIEFSISANVGVTCREDVEPRTRRISLAYFEEDPNKRTFSHPDLHGYVRANRGRVLGAVDAFVTEWIRQGMPAGTTAFTSFPEWARDVGGIMQSNGLGDPCLPHEDELELGGDLRERAMRAVYKTGIAKWPGEWVAKEDLFRALAETDDEDLAWFGPWGGEDGKGTRNKVGMALKAYKGRELGGVRLSIDENGKGAKQKVRFTLIEGGGSFGNGNPGNPGNLSSPPPSGKNDPEHLTQMEVEFPQKASGGKVSQVSEVSSTLRVVTDARDFPDITDELSLASSVALDTETYGPGNEGALDPRKGKIRLLQLAVPGQDPWVIDLKRTGSDLGPLKELLESVEVIAHNARFDLGFLREQLGIFPARVYCTMTASQVLTAGAQRKNDLFTCLKDHLGIAPYPDESCSDWSGSLTERQMAYAAADVRHLHDLREALGVQIDQAGLRRVVDLEMNLVPVVVGIEAVGIRLDVGLLEKQIENASRTAEDAREELHRLSGKPDLNPNSAQQVQAVLREQGLNLPNTKKETLAAHANKDLVAKLLEFRREAKLVPTLKNLREKIDSDGRLRASFNPMGTCTGRFSSSKPNLQNIPRGAPRSIFVPAPGCKFVRADYGQVELRIAASLAGESGMLEAFHRGEDLHILTAALITGKDPAEVTKQERQEAKAVNFGFLYGQGAEGFQKQARADYGLEISLERAKELRASFFESYPGFTHWHATAWEKARQGVGETRTRYGRRRLLSSETSEWRRFTTFVNTPVQGLGGDGMKLALIRLARELPDSCGIVLTVHDDVLTECPEALSGFVKALVEKILVEVMSELLPEVPFEVEAEVLSAWH